MGEKLVTDIAGIGKVYGGRLEEKGYDKAYVLLGQFLLLKKDEELFAEWLKDEICVSSKCSRDAATCMKEWCGAFM